MDMVVQELTHDDAGTSHSQRRRVRSTALLPWRLRKVKDFIDSDIAAPFRIRDLAAAAGLSRMHFAAQFRIATGLKPHEYVLIRRIEYAKRLLHQENTTLEEIAAKAGFHTQVNFCKIFKRLTGTTPSEFQRQVALAPKFAASLRDCQILPWMRRARSLSQRRRLQTISHHRVPHPMLPSQRPMVTSRHDNDQDLG